MKHKLFKITVVAVVVLMALGRCAPQSTPVLPTATPSPVQLTDGKVVLGDITDMTRPYAAGIRPADGAGLPPLGRDRLQYQVGARDPCSEPASEVLLPADDSSSCLTRSTAQNHCRSLRRRRGL